MTEHLHLNSFETHVNETYQLALGPDQSVELVLESVELYKAPSPEYECFSLMFKGARQDALAQGTYKMTNEHLGTFPLFIVPVQADDQHYYYEAVFNRKKTGA